MNLLEGIKPIDYKRVYKRKRWVDGKVETFKTRIVVKCYIQRDGIDYKEIFSPIRILLSIVASLDYEIWKIDIKTAFLNDNLDKSNYMVQLEKFIKKGQEGKVCELKRFIYGLKQASCSWNKCFD